MLRQQAEARLEGGASQDLRRFMQSVSPSEGEIVTAPVLGSRAHTELFQYWMSLPRRDGMPDTTDFDPAAIMQWLPDIAIMDILSPDDITHRLVGTGLAERLGYDATGKNLLDLVVPPYREQCSRDMHEAVSRPCGWQARYLTHYTSGRVANVQSLYLPLRGPGEKPPRIVSVHTPEESLDYRAPNETPRFATEIDRIVWIDTGHGAPGSGKRAPH